MQSDCFDFIDGNFNTSEKQTNIIAAIFLTIKCGHQVYAQWASHEQKNISWESLLDLLVAHKLKTTLNCIKKNTACYYFNTINKL